MGVGHNIGFPIGRPIGFAPGADRRGGVNPNVLTGNERIVAKGGTLPTTAANAFGYTRSERRTPCWIGRENVKSIRVIIWNGYVSAGEKNGVNNITVETALERITGTPQTEFLRFNGALSKVLAPGEWAVSDPIFPSRFLLSAFQANEMMAIRTGCTLAIGTDKWPYTDTEYFERMPSGLCTVWNNSPTSQIGSTGALALNGGVNSNNTNIGAYGICAIIGEWETDADVSVFSDGDSIPSRLNDVVDQNGAGGGYFIHGTRSVSGGTLPCVKVSRGSERVSHWASGNTFRTYLMGFCTHYHANFGTNDIAGGATAAATLAAKKVIWAAFKANGMGAKYIIDSPVAPRATSTDSWATTANQTPATGYAVGAARDVLNASVVAIVGLSDGPDEIIDVNIDWQDSVSTASWKPTGVANAPTADGVHPSPAYHVTASARVATAAASWTP